MQPADAQKRRWAIRISLPRGPARWTSRKLDDDSKMQRGKPNAGDSIDAPSRSYRSKLDAAAGNAGGLTKGSEDNAAVKKAILDDPSKDIKGKKYENKVKYINQVTGIPGTEMMNRPFEDFGNASPGDNVEELNRMRSKVNQMW